LQFPKTSQSGPPDQYLSNYILLFFIYASGTTSAFFLLLSTSVTDVLRNYRT